MSHKKVNVSLPTAKFHSANSNKNIKSNDTELHFVFLLLVGLDAISRAYLIQGTILSRDS